MAGGQRNSANLALRVLALGLLATTCLTGHASANPAGGSVAVGQATISQLSATSTIITQLSSKALINWSSFSIPGGSSVTVHQPGASSILVDRVTGGSRSLLFGTLTANGQVWLINGAGIVVGAGANITAAGVLLSTAGIADGDFSAGSYNFGIAGSPGAAVVNRGAITATDGSAVLAGEQVTNRGVVAARLGTVALVGAKTYAVDFAGDGLLKFAITAPVEQVAPGAQALIENSGTLAADGGTVLLTAAAAKGVIENVINTSGIIEATSVANINGQIVLSGSGGGTMVSGTLDASGKGAGETGGQVAVLGDSVTLAPGARIDVSGDAGGGTALIGGNFHGAGPQQNAQATTVAQGATIDADALSRGNGGGVAVWSDGATSVAGTITARGGAQGGNGGSVETSGTSLNYAGITVDTSAAHGSAGNWLLDPFDLTIDASGAAALVSALGDGNVTVMTTATGASGFGTANASGNGDITVAANIVWNSANALTLSAYRNIDVGATIASQGGGNVTLQADNSHAGVGIVAFNGGSITTDGMVAIFEPPPGYAITHYAPEIASPWLLVAYVDDSIATFTGSGSSGRATFPGGDLLAWGQLGEEGALVADGSTATSQGGTQVTVSGQAPRELQRRDEGNGWAGEFQNGDQLIFYQTSGSLTLTFPSGVTGVGVEVKSDAGAYPPTFTATATIYTGATPLASLMGTGAAGSCGACNTAPFLGFVDNSGPNITSMKIGLTANDTSGFSINQLSLGGSGTGVLVNNNGNNSQQTTTGRQGQLASTQSSAPPQTPPPPPPPPQIAPPPISSPPLIFSSSDDTGAGALTSVSDIDQGGQLFTVIAPNSGNDASSQDPVVVTPVKTASQPQPKPQATDTAVGGRGSNIFQSKPFFVPFQGVPGISGPASTSGNRSLWFANGAT